jgi:hypothetical protein
MATLDQNIETLFAQIGGFESGSTAFSTGAFIQNFNGILSAFELLPSHPEQSSAADEILYRKIREAGSKQSLLRYEATNILGMFLYARASGTSQYLRSYQELLRLRPDNATSDGDFIERRLVPSLLQLRALGGDAVLGTHLLLKLADFLQTFGAPATFAANASRAELERRSLPMLLLGFARRRLESSGRLLREESGALEYGLKRDGFFQWMSAQGRQKNQDVEPYLRQLDLLLSSASWWQRLLAALGRASARLGAGLQSAFAWLPAGGVFWSAFWIFIGIVVIVAVPFLWFLHYEHRLQDFQQSGTEVATKKVEVLPRSAGEAP